MIVPNGFSEAEVLQTIEDVVAKLAGPFKFGFHDTDDMKQEGRIMALEALPRFDASLGTLRTFLTNHVRNRFINMQRDKLERRQPPCSSCPFYIKKFDKCGAFATKDECEKWTAWKTRNLHKRNLMEGYNPNSVSENSGDTAPPAINFIDDISNKEIVEYIDKEMPIAMRADYLRLINGVKLPKNRRDKILEVVKEIFDRRFVHE